MLTSKQIIHSTYPIRQSYNLPKGYNDDDDTTTTTTTTATAAAAAAAAGTTTNY